MSKIPGIPLSEEDRKKFYDGLSKAQKAREVRDFPPAGKTCKKLMPCPNDNCRGNIVKETEISYPNPEGRLGGPRAFPRHTHRAYCNGCAQLYAVDVLERILAQSAP